MNITKEQASSTATNWFNETFRDELLLKMSGAGLIELPAYEFRRVCISNLKAAIANIDNDDFQPDWSTIVGDWLAMDADGEWYSYHNKPEYVRDMWMMTSGDTYPADDYSCTIAYRHPNAEEALYRRPE